MHRNTDRSAPCVASKVIPRRCYYDYAKASTVYILVLFPSSGVSSRFLVFLMSKLSAFTDHGPKRIPSDMKSIKTR